MSKRIVSVVLALILVLAVTVTAFADVNSAQTYKSLSFSGTTAFIAASVAQGGAEISLSAELWQGGTMIDYWDDLADNTAAVSGSVSGCTSGLTYTLYVYATVDGDPVYISPISKVCP